MEQTFSLRVQVWVRALSRMAVADLQAIDRRRTGHCGQRKALLWLSGGSESVRDTSVQEPHSYGTPSGLK